MKNPFIYGKIVSKDDFADRRKEIELLKDAILSRQNVIIYSPRRYGKSSLVYNVIQDLDITSIWMDCYGIVSKKEFAEEMVSKVIQNWKSKRILETMKRLFKSVRPRIKIGETIEVEFSIEEEDKAFEESLELPQKLAEHSKEGVVVVFDEFQEITKLGSDVLAKMRSAFQRHMNVCYIFIGSKRGIMERIFRSGLSPFYNFGIHIILNKIPKKDFKEFIYKKFKNSGIAIYDDAIDEILEITECHPYYTQMLCHRLWFKAFMDKRDVKIDDVKETVEEVILEQEDSYMTIWDDLTLSQRKMLIAIAKEEKDFYSVEFLRKYRFKRASNVQTAIKGLMKREIIFKIRNKYEISDPFFKLWILQNIAKESSGRG